MWNCCLPSAPRLLFHSIPLDVCLVTQLERCYYVSSHELILSCSVFEKINSSRVFLSSSCHASWSSQRKTSSQRWWLNQRPYEVHLDREDYTSLRSPFILPYAWISGRDSCLVGVSCHNPSSGLACLCFSLYATTLKWGLINPSSKWNSTRVQIKSFSLNPKCPSKMFIIFALV